MKKILILSMVMALVLAGCTPHDDHDGCTHCHHTHEVTIGFAGDVMIGRTVNEYIKSTGYTSLWGSMLPLLRSTDFTIANLETTLTRSKKKVPKVFNFQSDPEHVQALKEAKIDIVTLANNHSLDFGVEGLKDTLIALTRAHIRYVGAGLTEQQARKPLILKKQGVTIGILAYTDNEPGWIAQGNNAGTNVITIGDITRVQEDVRKIRDHVDIIIATMHWGPNMQQRPSKEHIDFAHRMIDAGIDVIHGHSSHVFQGIELYKDKLIMYDTGDFIDDYAIDSKLHNDQSFFAQVTIKKNSIKKVTITPIVINDMQVNVANDKEAVDILNRLKDLSAELGTDLGKAPFKTMTVKTTI